MIQTHHRAPMRPLYRFLGIVFVVAVAACSLPPRASAKPVTCQYLSNLTAEEKASGEIAGLLERRLANGSWVTEPTTVVPATQAGLDAALRTLQDFAPGTYTFRVFNVRTQTSERSDPSNEASVTVKARPSTPSGAIITMRLDESGAWSLVETSDA